MMTREQQQARDAWLARNEAEAQKSLGEINGIEAYAKATDDQKAIIAFGMTPIELFPVNCAYGGRAAHPQWRTGFAIGLMTAARMNGGMRV